MSLSGADVSHFQPNPNFAQVKASGRSFVVLKATEGIGYTDPTMAARRAAAHAAGLIVGLYHFARAGDPAAEARYFLSLIGALQPGEFLVLDWEVSGANPPAWCKAWLDAVYAATGVRPLIYMNSTAMTGSNWSAVVAGNYALWLASYDSSTAPPAVKWWAAAAMKQFSDAGNVPGIGICDVNVFYGDEAALLRYGKQPDPAPTPQEDDLQTDERNWLEQVYNAIFSGGPSMPGGLPLPQATAYAVWRGTTVTRTDSSTGGKTQNIPVIQELADAKTQAIAANAALATVVQALAGSKGLDAQALQDAVKTAVTDALASSTVKVDVNVTGGDPQAGS